MQITRYNFIEYYGQTDFGFNLDTRAQFRAGLRTGAAREQLETGLPILPDLAVTRHSEVVVGATWDTLNTNAVATRGTLAKISFIQKPRSAARNPTTRSR